MLPDYETLERRVVEFGARYPEHVPRPPYWGGYLLRPDEVELWQGRPNLPTTACATGARATAGARSAWLLEPERG